MKRQTKEALRAALWAILAFLVALAITALIEAISPHLGETAAFFIIPALQALQLAARRYWLENKKAADPGVLVAQVLEDYDVEDLIDMLESLRSPDQTRAAPKVE